MSLLSELHRSSDLNDRLRTAHAMTDDLFGDVIRKYCRQPSSTGQIERMARIKQLIDSKAWTDAAMALIGLELPFWQIRRIVYDQGEWHCALSRVRELPDWLDRSIEGCHADLPLAILCAFIDAKQVAAPASRGSVPFVERTANALCEPVCCDNFG